MTFILVLASSINASYLFAQGCSDAGLCTAGGMKDNGTAIEKSSFTLNNQFGVGEQKTNIFSTQLEYQRRLSDMFSIQFKLPWVFASGNLGSNNGIGDITIAASYKTYDSKPWKINSTLGFKLPTGSTDKGILTINPSNQIYSFPMPYQTGLGTFDLLLGMDFKYNDKWLLALGFQLPLIQNNKNSFDTSIRNLNSEQRAYFSSSSLKRNADFVLRLERKFKLNDRTFLSLGTIPIFHLGNDNYTPLSTNHSAEIQNSSGLTLNVGGGLMHYFSDEFSVSLKYASPLIVRKVRPDGLTREFVAGLELKYALF